MTADCSGVGDCESLIDDVSVGGMFVVGPTLPVGATVEWTVELPAPLGPVKVIGEVRFVRAASGIGVRFTRLSPDDITKLQRFIATAPPATRIAVSRAEERPPPRGSRSPYFLS